MFGIPLTAYALKTSVLLNVGLVVLLIAGLGFQQYRVVSAQKETAEAKTETAKVKTEFAKYKTKIAEERLAFETAARKKEQENTKKLAEITDTFTKELTDVREETEKVVADLRAGNLRLRRHWEAAIATSELSQNAASLARADEDAELRRNSVGRILRAVGQCQAQVIGLQAVVRVCQNE